jgi:hypothetical protein
MWFSSAVDATGRFLRPAYRTSVGVGEPTIRGRATAARTARDLCQHSTTWQYSGVELTDCPVPCQVPLRPTRLLHSLREERLHLELREIRERVAHGLGKRSSRRCRRVHLGLRRWESRRARGHRRGRRVAPGIQPGSIPYWEPRIIIIPCSISAGSPSPLSKKRSASAMSRLVDEFVDKPQSFLIR